MKTLLLTCTFISLINSIVAQQPESANFKIVHENFKKTLAWKVSFVSQEPAWLYGYYETDHTITMMGNDSIFISYAETDEAPRRDDVTISYDYGNVHTKLHNYTLSLKDVIKVSISTLTNTDSQVGYFMIETKPAKIDARLLLLEASYEIKEPSWESSSSTIISAVILDDIQEKQSVFLLPYLKNDVYSEMQLIDAFMAYASKHDPSSKEN